MVQIKQERLDKAVENYAWRPAPEADDQRLNQNTKAREIRKNTDMDLADKVNHFKNPGYTTDKLMNDIRFKVNAALTGAGLQGTAYGKQVMQGLVPRV